MSVFGIVKDIKGFFSVATDKARIDNLIFQAHYRFTTSIFMVSSMFLTGYSLIGNPIYCTQNAGHKDDFLNQYCWTMNTYSLKKSSLTEIYGGVIALKDPIDSYKIVHTYYQWVPFVLFFHGLCFYLPHWIWKTWEGGRVKLMCKDIRGTLIADNDATKQKREQVVGYIIDTLHSHKKYAYAYFFCEILNFLNTIFTMYLINWFLNGAFSYSWNLWNITRKPVEERIGMNDTLMEIFPRMTICDILTVGSAGGSQKANALCVLPLNALNEKIYIFVWFWLMFLAGISFIAIAYSAAFLALPDIRRMVIVNRFKVGNKYEVNELIRQIGVGDFLLLHLLGQNLSTMSFRKLLEDLNNKLLYPHKSIQSNTQLTKVKPIDQDDYPQKPKSDSMYPTYFKPTDALDIDSVDSDVPLILRERTANQVHNEKTLPA